MRQKSQIPSQRRLLILVIEKGVSAVELRRAEREEGAKLFALTGQ